MEEVSEKLLKQMATERDNGNKLVVAKKQQPKQKQEEPVRPVLHTEDDNGEFLQF